MFENQYSLRISQRQLERSAQAFCIRVKFDTDVRAERDLDGAHLKMVAAATVVEAMGDSHTLPTLLDSAKPFPELLSRL